MKLLEVLVCGFGGRSSFIRVSCHCHESAEFLVWLSTTANATIISTTPTYSSLWKIELRYATRKYDHREAIIISKFAKTEALVRSAVAPEPPCDPSQRERHPDRTMTGSPRVPA